MAFRRLAWQRSWFAIALGLIVAGLAGVALADATYLRPTYPRIDQAIAAIAGLAVGLVLVVRGVVGSWSRAQLAVDVPAGRLRLASGEVVAFDDLGALAMTSTRQYHRTSSHELRAANVPAPLFSALFFRDVVLRHTALARAILQFRLRRALEAPAVEGDAFRAGVDVASMVEGIAGDSVHVRAVLGELARDHDPTIRERAAQLLANHP